MKKNGKADFKVAVLASCGGGNFQALIDNRLKLGYTVTLLIADRKCGALQRAKLNDIPFLLVDKKKLKENFSQKLIDSIPEDAGLIVLAGFMSILSKEFCEKWKGRIINTHPSLLPKHGGIGMYGVKVQEQVMKSGDKKAGCTVHYVTPAVDGGEIILQKEIDVDYAETPWELGSRVHDEEIKLLPRVIQIIKRRIKKS